jgi:hypothetical protein
MSAAQAVEAFHRPMRSLVSFRHAASPLKPGARALDALMFAGVMLAAAALVLFLGAESARWSG